MHHGIYRYDQQYHSFVVFSDNLQYNSIIKRVSYRYIIHCTCKKNQHALDYGIHVTCNTWYTYHMNYNQFGLSLGHGINRN